MKLFKTDRVGSAIAAASKAIDVTKTITGQLSRLDTEREALEISAGESAFARILDGGEVEGSDELVRNQSKSAALRRALVKANSQALGKIRSIYSTAAQVQRDEASALRKEAAKIVDGCRKFLEELGRLQGIPYTPAILLAERVPGGFFKRGSQTVPADEGDSPMQTVEDFMGTARYYVPKSTALIEEAAKLEASGTSLESQAAGASGDDLDSLFNVAVAAVGRTESEQRAA